MTTGSDKSRELLELISDLTDGSLTAEQRTRLAELLRDDPQAQLLYAEQMRLHALLHLEYGQGTEADDSPGLAAMPHGSLHGNGNKPTARNRGGRLMQWSKSRWRQVVVAAVASIAILEAVRFGWWFATTPSQNRPVAESLLRTDGPETVAVLTRGIDTVWNGDQKPAVGQELAVGGLDLEKGIVQIEFFGGASVIIRGPARFDLVSTMAMKCSQGEIRAHVPNQARGFQIITPKVIAIDQGTEFAMRLDGAGRGEIHVLDGEVDVNSTTEDGPTTRLLAGNALDIGEQNQWLPVRVEEDDFVGRLSLSNLTQIRDKSRHDNWMTHSQRLAEDPALLRYFTFDGHDEYERVLRNVGPTKDHSADAAIVGCLWTRGRWPQKQALEFKRPSDRVLLDIPGEFESVTLLAWVRLEGLDQWLSSLLLTDGFEPGEIHWQLSDKGEIILGVSDGGAVNYFSPTVLGPADLGRWIHLATVHDGKLQRVTHYVDGQIVSEHAVENPVALRIGKAEIGNWDPKELKGQLIRSLNGRIDEFAVLGRAMSQKEIHVMYENGKPE